MKIDDDNNLVDIKDIKKETHQSAEQAKKDVTKLNKLLKANGITLRIHIATTGEKYHGK